MAVTTSYLLSERAALTLHLDFPHHGIDAIGLANGGLAYALTTEIGFSAYGVLGADGVLVWDAAFVGLGPSIAQLANGNVVTATIDGQDIRFTIRNAVNGELIVLRNSVDEADSAAVDVAALGNGGFVIVSQDNYGGTDNDIGVQIFAADGTRLSNLSVDTSLADDRNPTVTRMGSNAFAVVWERHLADGTNQLWEARYGDDGTVLLAPQITVTNLPVTNPVVFSLDNGNGYGIVTETRHGAQTDITIAGTTGFIKRLTNSSFNETNPDAETLSNGMIGVVYQDDSFGASDSAVRLMLVDPGNGGVLSQATFNFFPGSETNPAIAAMSLGRMAVFSDTAGGTVEGRIIQAVRVVKGDGGGDTIIGDSLDDQLSGNGGDDYLYGGANADGLFGGAGDDTLAFMAGDVMAGEIIEGGDGADVIDTRRGGDTQVVDFTAAQRIAGIELLDILGGVIFRADQLADLGSLLLFNQYLEAATVQVNLGSERQSFDGGVLVPFVWGENDRVVIVGDGDAETIAGTSHTDILRGNGGDDVFLIGFAQDHGAAEEIAGGDGADTIRFTATTPGQALVLSALVTGVEFFSISDSAGNGSGTTALDIDASAVGYGVDVTGNAGANVLTGTGFADTLAGGGGGADRLLGGGGNDLLLGDGGDDTLDGAGGDDVLIDGSGDDRLSGGAGNDTLFGGSGNDLLEGGDGADELTDLSGADTLAGGLGDDIYYVFDARAVLVEAGGAAAGADTVVSGIDWTLGANFEVLQLLDGATAGTGNGGDNLLVGNAQGNRLSGGGGADTLDGGAGADTLSGGAGNDIYMVDDVLDRLSEAGGGGADTVYATVDWTLGAGFEGLFLIGDGLAGTGNGSNNTIDGNFGDDTLNGAGGDDHLIGDGGDDSLVGGTGADTLHGGDGNDTYQVDNAGDVIIERLFGFASSGFDEVRSTIDYTLGDLLEALTLLGAAVRGTGNADHNRIVGNGAANLLAGLDGADTLDGGGGADTLVGGRGDDRYVVNEAGDVVVELANGGIDHVVSGVTYTLGAHVETLELSGSGGIGGTGNNLANLILGNAGNNSLAGGTGDDTLIGGGGSDKLSGNVGADRMLGGLGNDRYFVDSILDIVLESAGEGNDTVVATIDYTLGEHLEGLQLGGGAGLSGTGNELANRIAGNAGANLLRGFGGVDALLGGDGADTLDGGAGRDVLTGGAGADLFLCGDLATGPDRVADFQAGLDRIGIVAEAFGLAPGALDPGRFVAHASAQATSAAGTGQFIYQTNATALLWDADGAGGAAAVRVATLTGGPALSASDFILV